MCQRELTTDGFAFLDIDCPYVAWAADRGILITPQRVPMKDGRLVSWWFANLLRNPAHLERELVLERVRKQQFPERISRLVGIFCFLEKACADQAIRWGYHFRTENLAELSLVEASGHDQLLDANWITYSDPGANSRDDKWMQRYWSGERYPDVDPVWEALVEGKVIVLGTALRERAYEVVKAHWPDSLMLLEISRLGAWIGSNIGTINVFMAENEREYAFGFKMDMRDATNADFRERLERLMASGHPVNWADIGPHYERGTFGCCPDMTPYQFTIPRDPRLP